jgi:hypothetical protein
LNVKKPRLNLELDHATKARLDRLHKTTGAVSLTGVIRKALRLYEAVLECEERGGRVVLRSGNEEREVLFL